MGKFSEMNDGSFLVRNMKDQALKYMKYMNDGERVGFCPISTEAADKVLEDYSPKLMNMNLQL